MKAFRIVGLAAGLSCWWTAAALADLNYDWRETEEYALVAGGIEYPPMGGTSNDTAAGAYDFGSLGAGAAFDTLTHVLTPPGFDPAELDYRIGSDLVSLSHGGWTQAQDFVMYGYKHEPDVDVDWYAFTPLAGRSVSVSLLEYQPVIHGVTIGDGETVESDWLLEVFEDDGVTPVASRSGAGSVGVVSDGETLLIRLSDPTPGPAPVPDTSDEHPFYRLLIEDNGPADGAVPAPGAAVGMLGLAGALLCLAGRARWSKRASTCS